MTHTNRTRVVQDVWKNNKQDQVETSAACDFLTLAPAKIWKSSWTFEHMSSPMGTTCVSRQPWPLNIDATRPPGNSKLPVWYQTRDPFIHWNGVGNTGWSKANCYFWNYSYVSKIYIFREVFAWAIEHIKKIF